MCLLYVQSNKAKTLFHAIKNSVKISQNTKKNNPTKNNILYDGEMNQNTLAWIVFGTVIHGVRATQEIAFHQDENPRKL